MPRDVYGFAIRQQIYTHGLGYNLLMKGNDDKVILNRTAVPLISKTMSKATNCYLQHFTANAEQQDLLSKHIIGKAQIEINYVERSVHIKAVITQLLWTFEQGNGEGIIIPVRNIV